jgi:hypothetical protein
MKQADKVTIFIHAVNHPNYFKSRMRWTEHLTYMGEIRKV